MKNNFALICVDPQVDFMPNGSLAVEEGDKIIPIINKILSDVKFDVVVFTQDWHPADHKSFASQHEDKKIFEEINLNGINQTLWPDHCVQNTPGAEFHDGIDISKINNFYIFRKGMYPNVDSYSGFYDNNKANSTGLAEFLNEHEITNVFVVGLAFDYCVAYTAIDAAMEGFKTTIIKDATKAISKDLIQTLQSLKDAEVQIIDSWELPMYKVIN
jgi:nicotinamidase/pyrazinamidase